LGEARRHGRHRNYQNLLEPYLLLLWGGMSFELIVGKEGEKKGKEKSLDSINVGISYF
jgi:hypothetical protein